MTTIFIIVIIATLKDKNQNLKSKYQKIFFCFSLKRNLKNLTTDHADSIKCLNGIKFIFFVATFIFHLISFKMVFPFFDGKNFTQFTDGYLKYFVFSLVICMDGFFLMSGLLAAKSIRKNIEEKNFHIWKFYFIRYMRLTPLVIFSMILMPFGKLSIGKSPYFFTYSAKTYCRDYWWSVLIHSQNLINPDKMVSRFFLMNFNFFFLI